MSEQIMPSMYAQELSAQSREIVSLRTRLAESEALVNCCSANEIGPHACTCRGCLMWQCENLRAAEAERDDLQVKVGALMVELNRHADDARAYWAERDDLLGALREIGALLYAQALYGTEGHAKVVEAHSRARAAIAKVGGP